MHKHECLRPSRIHVLSKAGPHAVSMPMFARGFGKARKSRLDVGMLFLLGRVAGSWQLAADAAQRMWCLRVSATCRRCHLTIQWRRPSWERLWLHSY
jgi:hypothetical protein